METVAVARRAQNFPPFTGILLAPPWADVAFQHHIKEFVNFYKIVLIIVSTVGNSLPKTITR